jgi:hypothetical protein
MRTYVNSGNVVFSGRRSTKHLETALAETFIDVPVVLRTRARAGRGREGESTQDRDRSGKHPSCSALSGVRHARRRVCAGDVRREQGGVPLLPGGTGRHREAARGGTRGRTARRNWRTVEKLLAMADDEPGSGAGGAAPRHPHDFAARRRRDWPSTLTPITSAVAGSNRGRVPSDHRRGLFFLT